MKHYSLAIPRNLAYWMARYSGNWTKKNLCCAVKPCDAGLRFLIFDIYFAHKTEAYILICWLLVLILLESVACLACLLKEGFFFSPFPIMEGKSLGSALLPCISNITEKLLYKSGAFWLWFCRNQSLVTGFFEKKSISLFFYFHLN